MKEVFTDPEFAVVGFLQTEFRAAGIPSFVRNQHADTALTGAPSALFWPALCVTNDDDLPRAQEIVARFMRSRKDEPDSDQPDWQCSCCHEMIPATLGECWNCATPRVRET